jgi:hypothetical protein
MPVPLGSIWPPSSDGGGCNQHAQHTNAPQSHDRGYQAHVASVVRRGAATSTRHTPTLPDLTTEANQHPWPPSSDGGAATNTRHTPTLPDLTIEATKHT